MWVVKDRIGFHMMDGLKFPMMAKCDVVRRLLRPVPPYRMKIPSFLLNHINPRKLPPIGSAALPRETTYTQFESTFLHGHQAPNVGEQFGGGFSFRHGLRLVALWTRPRQCFSTKSARFRFH